MQHIEYVPFGEVFVEERNNIWNTPYLFNAKEFDEETGLYYYGARYYDPRVNLWISVDPLAENKPNYSSYNFVSNNPLSRVDFWGLTDYEVDGQKRTINDGNKDLRIAVGKTEFTKLQQYFNKNRFSYDKYMNRMQLYYYKVVLCISNSVLQCCKRKPLKAKKNVIEALVDAKCSTIILVADVTMLAFTALLLWTMINFTSMIFPWLSLVHTEKITFCIITVFPVLFINYRMLWRNDRYIEYFKIFQKATLISCRIWSIITGMCVLIVFALFIFSLSIM